MDGRFTYLFVTLLNNLQLSLMLQGFEQPMHGTKGDQKKETHTNVKFIRQQE